MRYDTDQLPINTQAQLNQLLASPNINANAISGFTAVPNSTTNGIDVSFSLSDQTGIASINLLRNFVMDIGTATVLQSWQPVQAAYAWSDTDNALQSTANAYYWLVLNPVGTVGKALTVGPQIILLNPQLIAPNAATGISASGGAVTNGKQLITVNVATTAPSTKIYVSGYHGNASFVAVAQTSLPPLQFYLDVTGETVTLEAIAVSTGGAEANSGPTTTIILNGAKTVPAKPEGVIVTQIATGNQIDFPTSKDQVTSYQIYRGQRGTIFAVSTLLATVTSTSGTINYLDTGGLTGDWQYFVVAVNAVGNSNPSDPASPPIQYTSATIPTNVAANTSNTSTVDSIDAGSNALIRIYGPGGVGTSYSRITGFGTLTRSPGTISGLGYSTLYNVMWTGSVFLAATTYPQTLPDGYEFVGSCTTTAATGTTGSGATVSLVIDGSGHVIQANPVNLGSGYSAASVLLTGGGGSGAQIQANVVGGQVTSYTVISGGTGYATAPSGTVVGTTSTGTTGGGGSTGNSDGSRIGCVEEGTFVEVPEGTTQELIPCSDWIAIDLGDGPVVMHPDTLVSVFRRAGDITHNDMVETKGANWAKPLYISSDNHKGIKVKRKCPGGTYHAGPNLMRLHNAKDLT